uniref:NADH dehydrogenase [ubiquinone] 1 beta subcomplex subunit 9 n=1 Tax=Xenopsylla cheopis TaxID=163159 RepID=A0A6M2DCY4_XENCH
MSAAERVVHVRRVCNLYRAVLRNVRSWYYERPLQRIKMTEARHAFEKNRCLISKADIEKAINAAEDYIFQEQHYCPLYYAHSPNGVAYQREVVAPDWVLDYWHPLEKAMYPKYFKKREERKKEYLEWYDKMYRDDKKP